MIKKKKLIRIIIKLLRWIAFAFVLFVFVLYLLNIFEKPLLISENEENHIIEILKHIICIFCFILILLIIVIFSKHFSFLYKKIKNIIRKR